MYTVVKTNCQSSLFQLWNAQDLFPIKNFLPISVQEISFQMIGIYTEIEKKWLIRLFPHKGFFLSKYRVVLGGFSGGSVVKCPPASAGDARDMGSISGSGRSPEEENGSPLQYSHLGNPMDRGAWQAAVHGATKSRTRLSTHVYTQWTLVYSQNWATITHYQS